MDIIITFFRDVLDGPLYVVIAIINSILICSCIGYLGEQYLNKQKKKEEYAATHVEVNNDQTSVQANVSAPAVSDNNNGNQV